MKYQYFYKMNECEADSAKSKDCICWHDEGTGPLVYERHDHKNGRIYNRILEWRVKPDELADLKLRCEEQQQKLDEMAKAFSQQQDRIKRLVEAGDAMASWAKASPDCHYLFHSDERSLRVNNWIKSKEAKP